MSKREQLYDLSQFEVKKNREQGGYPTRPPCRKGDSLMRQKQTDRSFFPNDIENGLTTP
jgi:hypothetical protein